MKTLGRIMRRRDAEARDETVTDRGLLADVEHLAEVVAETIGRLHAARRGDIARPLEDALARLGGRR